MNHLNLLFIFFCTNQNRHVAKQGLNILHISQLSFYKEGKPSKGLFCNFFIEHIISAFKIHAPNTSSLLSSFALSRNRVPYLNVKKILAVINATYAVAKRKPEKVRLAGIRTLTSAIPVQRCNQLNDQLPVGLLAQLVRALHRYRRGQGSNPGKPDFFRLSFRNCISCVNNCEDLLYIYVFIPQFKYMNFIYS